MAAPRRVIAGALLVMLATAIFGIPVVNGLSAGGMRDPGAQSSEASKVLSDKFDQGDLTMVVSVRSDSGVDSPAAQAVGRDIVEKLEASRYVGQVVSAWTSPSPAALVSEDHNTGLVVAGVFGDDNEAQ